MGDTNERLNISDQVLANAMNFLVTVRSIDDGKRAMMLAVIEDVLPGVNQDHFIMGRMAEQAEVLLQTSGGEVGLFSLFDAARVMAVFAEWRTGLALEARNQAVLQAEDEQLVEA